VDPRTVYISEEGTVALVRPKSAAPAGDAETSVRAILAKLLEASGSATPALTASARRKAGAGLPALVSELEAALIPVNRAAGRRALARLAREVKRVTLGVGRNASMPSPVLRPAAPRAVVRESSPDDVMSGPDAPPGPRGSVASFADEALTAKRQNQLADLAAQMNAPDLVALNMPAGLVNAPNAPSAPKPVVPNPGLTPPPHPGSVGAAPGLSPPPPIASAATAGTPPAPPVAAPAPPTPPPPAAALPAGPPAAPPLPVRAGGPPPVPPPRAGAPLPPPPARAGGSASPPVVGPPPRVKSAPAGPPGPAAAERAEIDKLFGGDEVDSLLSTFEVSSVGDKQVRNDLKAIAGLDPTPAPPDATTLAELTKDVGKDLPKRQPSEGDSVEALLALSERSASVPVGAPAAPAPGPGAATARLPAGTAPPSYGPGLIPPASAAMPPSGGLAPPSPLVPMTPVPGPTAPVTQSARHSPVPPMPALAAAAMEAALKRPVTPRQPGRPLPAPAPAPAPAISASGRREKADLPPAGSTSRRNKSTGRTGNFRQPRAPRTGLAMLVLTLFVLVAGGIAVWMFKPAFFTGKRKPLATGSTSAMPVLPPAPRCKVALVVSDVPANAEILLRMGQAPLDVERMPVGTRLEFVATAEGYAPRRAVIKAESTWDKAPDGKPRIDVPIQLDPTKAKPGAVDAWPVAEPGSQVGGSGSPGTVHVVSNVRGAEVWLLAGLGPEARIEQLRCDGDIDVLLAGPPQLRKRLHVGEKEIQAASPDPQGNRVVSVSAK
ncbi:MAG: hypothetical protein QOI41_4503, partial [Myxococcales bacterium]|nr:hypothetical protein [Myxococcales bacterium]